MPDTSWTPADPPLRSRLLPTGVVGCLVVAAAAFASRDWLHVATAYPWKATALFAAMALAAIGLHEAHPFPRLGLANQVTSVRAMLVALAAGFIGEVPTARIAWAGVVITTVVAALDGIDGWLARRTRMASAFGARIDMETDALLIMAVSVLVWQHGKAGAWVLLGGVMRYAFVASGWLLPWMARPLTPTLRAKTVTIVHSVGLTIALAPIIAPRVSTLTAATTLAALTWSFAVDVRRLAVGSGQ